MKDTIQFGSSQTLNTFRKHLKTHLFQSAFSDLSCAAVCANRLNRSKTILSRKKIALHVRVKKGSEVGSVFRHSVVS